MSYSIVTTPGFIIYSQNKGEADKLLWVFTRDLGLILANAQGIRLEKSKLRYFVRDYSFGEYSFVRGREFWRLTDARGGDFSGDKEIMVRVAGLLKRLLHGEEANPPLFDCIHTFYGFVFSVKLNDEQLSVLESLIVARILYFLGYIGDERDFNGYVRSNDISLELIEELKNKKTLLNKHINKALKESHL